MSIGGFAPVMPSAAHDARVHERRAEASQRAAQAGTRESEAADGDGDADGRQAWKWNQPQQKRQDNPEQRVKDLSGKTGTTLDLDG